VTVKGLAGSVVPHGGARTGVACGDLGVAQVDAGVEHGGDESVPELRVHMSDGYAACSLQLAQPADG
jgi:hypothetical protein